LQLLGRWRRLGGLRSDGRLRSDGLLREQGERREEGEGDEAAHRVEVLALLGLVNARGNSPRGSAVTRRTCAR
jgi:hypothetical protein